MRTGRPSGDPTYPRGIAFMTRTNTGTVECRILAELCHATGAAEPVGRPDVLDAMGGVRVDRHAAHRVELRYARQRGHMLSAVLML
jgi:hypothetical protein